MPNVECSVCKSVVYRRPTHLRQYKSVLCSKECRVKSMTTSKVYKCAYCGKDVVRRPGERNENDRYFCSHSHRTSYINSTKIGNKHPLWKGGKAAYRAKAIAEKGAECEVCGFDDERAIVVHHIDGDRQNNDIDNLQVLCANCHMIAHRPASLGR